MAQVGQMFNEFQKKLVSSLTDLTKTVPPEKTTESTQVLPDNKYFKAFRKLNALQNEVALGIKLPRIAVIGAQSSGKSSVMEKIIGFDILPKGKNLTTRCPIILNLYAADEEEYGTVNFGEKLSIQDVAFEIKKAAELLDDSKTTILDQEINVDIFLKNSLRLSLIDLPGFTKIPVGDQPDDIESKIEEMVLKYIKDENTLILAISPANFDLANSDALKIAKRVDREGKRTLGVITKIDMVDKNVDCLQILKNEVFPLKLGYIGVINRSVKDLLSCKSLERCLEQESAFFSTHKKYKKLTGKIGTAFLKQQLQSYFTKFLKDRLVLIKNRLDVKYNLLKSTKFELKNLKAGTHFYIQEYLNALSSALSGKHYSSDIFYTTQTFNSFQIEITRIFDRLKPAAYEVDTYELRKKVSNPRSTIFDQKKNIDGIIGKCFDNLLNKIIVALNECKSVFTKRIRAIQTKSHKNFLDACSTSILAKVNEHFESLRMRLNDIIHVEKNEIHLSEKGVDVFREILFMLYQMSERNRKKEFSLVRFFQPEDTIEKSDLFTIARNENDFTVEIVKNVTQLYYQRSCTSILDQAKNTVVRNLLDYITFMGKDLYKEKILFKKRTCRISGESANKIIELDRELKDIKRAMRVLKHI